MTMLIEIKPEAQAELSRQAAAQGVDVNAYAASLLEEAAHSPAAPKNAAQSETADSRRSLRDVFEAVRGLADDINFTRNPSVGRPVDLA
jgi:hypothetical protein